MIDEQVLSVVLVVCKFNLFTGIANGLGLELSIGFQSVVERWIVGPAKDQQWLMDPVQILFYYKAERISDYQ